MHIEKRKVRGKIQYYLSHSYRKAGRVKKARVYLGAGLSPDEVGKKAADAERRLLFRVEAGSAASDPLSARLSPAELSELSALAGRVPVKVAHLSEDDWQKFTEEFAYDTNAIEGSTVSLAEVGGILERDRWPDKPKEEISETYGVAKAIKFIRHTKAHVSIQLMLDLHRIVFVNSKPFAGTFRKRGVEVVVTDGHGGVVHRGAPSAQVRKLLERLVGWYEKNRGRYPPLVLAAIIHNQFENIHPFQDGNCRVGRLLLNNVLLKHGLPPLNIELKNRQEYYASLQAYEHGHDLKPSIKLMLKEYRALGKLFGKKGSNSRKGSNLAAIKRN